MQAARCTAYIHTKTALSRMHNDVYMLMNDYILPVHVKAIMCRLVCALLDSFEQLRLFLAMSVQQYAFLASTAGMH
jgi:hypothetical protein